VVGEAVNFTGTITNDGDVTLNNVTYFTTGEPYVSRNDGCAGTIATLRVGETESVSCRHVTRGREVPTAFKTLTVTATGMPSESATATVGVDRVRARVDGMLRWRLKDRIVIGDDVYGTKDNQSLNAQFLRGSKSDIIWQVQNDGNTTQRFTLKGGRGNDGYDVGYQMGKKDVTRKANRGKLRLSLRPGEIANVTVTIARNHHERNSLSVNLLAKGVLGTADTVTINARTIRDV
jgi:hypothetical protein